MMESDGKQCRALIGPFQVERFDLLPPHQSGGSRVKRAFFFSIGLVFQRIEPTVATCWSGRGFEVWPLFCLFFITYASTE